MNTTDERPDGACLTHRPPAPDRAWARADDGYATCGGCYDRLRDTLRDITRRYQRLSPIPGRGDVGRPPPGFGPSSPADEHILAMTDRRSLGYALHDDWAIEQERAPRSVPGTLAGIAAAVAEQRDMTSRLPATVADLAEWLDRHLDWITRQDWVDEFHSDLSELATQLRAVTDPRRSIGRCPVTIDEGEHTRECGARLYAPLRGDTITCPGCGETWQRADWLRLGDLLEV